MSEMADLCIVVSDYGAKATLAPYVRSEVRIVIVGEHLSGAQFDEILILGAAEPTEETQLWYDTALKQRLKHPHSRVRKL